MKKRSLLTSLILLIMPVSFLPINNFSHLPINNFNHLLSTTEHKQDMLKSNSSATSWSDSNLENFIFPTEVNKDSKNWDDSQLTAHDLNINYIDFKNATGEKFQQNAYLAIAKAFDSKYLNYEQKFFGNIDVLLNQAEIFPTYINSIFITIMSQSTNAKQAVNDNLKTFHDLIMQKNEIQSFYLRISNHASMDWNTNKSYFDVSLNICNFDTDTAQTLASKVDNLNVNCLPTSSVTSYKKVDTIDYGIQTAESHVDYITQNWSSHVTYGLHKENSSILHFSGSVINIDPPTAPEEPPIWKTVNWDGQGFNDPQQPGQISASKFCPNFNNISDIYKYVKSVSITSNCKLEDWCIPNSNSHVQAADNKTVTWNNNGSGLPTYNDVAINDRNLPWDRKPDQGITSAWQYIPNTQYDHTFGWDSIFHRAGHMYVAAFMVFCQSPVNNTDIDVFTMFTSQLDHTVLAGIKLKFLVNSTRITFNFDHTPFDNVTLPYQPTEKS